MNEDNLNQLLSSLSNIKGQEDLNRPSSPPCNNFSASILSAPLPTEQYSLQSESYSPSRPSYDDYPAVSSSSSSASAFVPYSPTNSPYSPTMPTYSPLATLPILSGSTDEKLDSILSYVGGTVRKLVTRLDDQEKELKDLRTQVNRRYQRHTSCITELQDKVYQGNGSRKRKRDETSPDLRYQALEEQLQQLQQMQMLQYQLNSQHPTSLQAPSNASLTPQYAPHEIRELRIKEAIGQFLISWNRNYRCGHNYRDNCKFEDAQCYRIHENSKHSVIARELRIVLQSGGDLSASEFFQNLLICVEERGYHCGETMISVQREIVSLAQKVEQV